MAHAAGIVLAAGSGRRMGAAHNKVYADVAGLPLLSYALQALNRSALVDRIVVVVRDGEYDDARRAIELALAHKTVAVVAGGEDRQDSERAGLDVVRAAVRSGHVDVVAIHDGARPFASTELIDEVIATARRIGGAVPGLPVGETLYEGRLDSPRHAERGLVRMQTPQAFRGRPLLAAYDAASREASFPALDTAAVVERFGALAIALVEGEERNIKVTYPHDVEFARRIAVEIRRVRLSE